MAHVNKGSHSFTCNPHVYPRMEWTIPAFTTQPQSITALWLALISHHAEGRRLSWPGWLGEILRWFGRQRRSPIPVLAGPDIEQLRWYAQQRYRYPMPPHVTCLSHILMDKNQIHLPQHKQPPHTPFNSLKISDPSGFIQVYTYIFISTASNNYHWPVN